MWECKGCMQTPCIAFRSADEDVCRCAYAYDDMGNISGDNLEIGYNFLNLPKETVKTTSERDRFGQMKQRKTYNYNRYLSDGAKVSSYDAAGNGYMYLGTARFSLDNDVPTIESVPFSGGSSIRTTNGYEPQYYLTDHLGSVRRVLDADLNVVERNDYYPFGKRIDDPECVISDNLYRYNGKESLEIFGIPYSDYGARLYDSNIGRWLQTDPQASDYPNISPYTFCANNPVKYVDPDGRIIRVFDYVDNERINYEWRQYDGTWGFYDKNNQLYNGNNDYISNLSTALSELMGGGNHGYDLVSTIAGSNNIVTVMSSDKSMTNVEGTMIGWNCTGRRSNNEMEEVLTTNGMNASPKINLGHELGHILYSWNGGTRKKWFSVNTDKGDREISISEIFATHIENKLRAENNLPLRVYYTVDSYGHGYGPKLISTSLGVSRYFSNDEVTNYRPLKKGIIPYKY